MSYLCIVKARSDEASRNYATFCQNNPFIPQEKAVLSSRLHRDTRSLTHQLMARERITFPVNLRQNTTDDSTAFGKWFPVPSTSEPMSLKGFAKHLSEHGKLASYDMCHNS